MEEIFAEFDFDCSLDINKEVQISVEQFGSITVYDDCEKAIQFSTLWQK